MNRLVEAVGEAHRSVSRYQSTWGCRWEVQAKDWAQLQVHRRGGEDALIEAVGRNRSGRRIVVVGVAGKDVGSGVGEGVGSEMATWTLSTGKTEMASVTLSAAL